MRITTFPFIRAFRLAFLVVAAVLMAGSPAMCVTPDEQLKDPGLEARARSISQGLRCVVCQNQSIDDSNAPLAKDLRVLVRERLMSGDSDKLVIDYVVTRYGNFILLKPPVQANTWLLWLGPFVCLSVALAVAFAFLKRHQREPQGERGAEFTPEERRRLDQLLEGGRAP